MTDYDRAFIAELKSDFARDLYTRVAEEHRNGLNTNPHYGMSAREILVEESGLSYAELNEGSWRGEE